MKRFTYTIDKDARLTSPIRALIPFSTFSLLTEFRDRLRFIKLAGKKV